MGRILPRDGDEPLHQPRRKQRRRVLRPHQQQPRLQQGLCDEVGAIDEYRLLVLWDQQRVSLAQSVCEPLTSVCGESNTRGCRVQQRRRAGTSPAAPRCARRSIPTAARWPGTRSAPPLPSASPAASAGTTSTPSGPASRCTAARMQRPRVRRRGLRVAQRHRRLLRGPLGPDLRDLAEVLCYDLLVCPGEGSCPATRRGRLRGPSAARRSASSTRSAAPGSGTAPASASRTSTAMPRTSRSAPARKLLRAAPDRHQRPRCPATRLRDASCCAAVCELDPQCCAEDGIRDASRGALEQYCCRGLLRDSARGGSCPRRPRTATPRMLRRGLHHRPLLLRDPLGPAAWRLRPNDAPAAAGSPPPDPASSASWALAAMTPIAAPRSASSTPTAARSPGTQPARTWPQNANSPIAGTTRPATAA